MSMSFRRMLDRTASTSRGAINASTGVSTSVAVLSNIAISELMPVTAEIRGRVVLDTPYEVLMAFCDDDMDIQPGDTLTPSDSTNVTNKDYAVRAVERWPWRNGTNFKAIIVEDIKT